ncbi:MAG: glycosyltransferase family 9 protein [Desulfohalobiaceae bacterium]
MSSALRSQLESVLVIRLSAIGDIVMASGIIPVLRSHLPQVRIDWLVQSECAGLLQGNPDLGQVLVWPRRDWLQQLRQGRLLSLGSMGHSLISQLRNQNYDLVLDLQGLWKSAWLALLCKGAYKVGLDSREGSGWGLNAVYRSPADHPGLASEYKHLLQELGFGVRDYSLGLRCTPGQERSAGQLLLEHGVQDRYAVFCPFSTREQKLWPMQHWRTLAAMLQDRLGLQAVILGGPGDREQAELLSTGQPQVRALAGETSLGQSLALIQAARLLIGVDTGLTHMGIMSEVPSIALFGSTRPYLQTNRANSAVLYKARSCSPCRRHPSCEGQYHCMRDLDPELVYSWAAKLLQSFEAGRAKVRTQQVQG